jgi:hypothetical protein
MNIPPTLLLRARCTQGFLVITDTAITIESSATLGDITPRTMLRASFDHATSAIVVPSIRNPTGGVNFTFFNQDGRALHANLVSPQDATKVHTILQGCVQAPVLQTPSSTPPPPMLSPSLQPPPPMLSPSLQPPPLPKQPMQQKMKTYKSGLGGTARIKFQKEVEKLLKEGWRVRNVRETAHTVDGQPTEIVVVYGSRKLMREHIAQLFYEECQADLMGDRPMDAAGYDSFLAEQRTIAFEIPRYTLSYMRTKVNATLTHEHGMIQRYQVMTNDFIRKGNPQAAQSIVEKISQCAAKMRVCNAFFRAVKDVIAK